MRSSNFVVAILFLFVLGRTVSREQVLVPGETPTTVERVVVEGPGGDMVSVGVETIERLAPLLPEPWNTLVVALTAGFSAATAGWVFRNRKEKKEAQK